jgi:subtilase family serine protease
MGTSFSAPIIAGMVACLWQALPHLNAYEIMSIVKRSSDRYSRPNNIFGYGVPDFWKAYLMGKKDK